MYVVNQGAYTHSDAAITRYDRATGAVVRNQFVAANPGITGGLGDVAQSMTIVGDKGYIVVNNSNRIAVVRMSDFKQIGQIDSLKLPRYLVAVGSKGYVTEYVSYTDPGRVTEIDLATNTLTGRTFVVGSLPEQIVATAAGQLIVANSASKTLSIIDPATAAVRSEPTTDTPTYLRLDAQGRVWVLCSGIVAYPADTTASTAGALVRFDPAAAAGSAALVLPFNRKGSAPGALTIDAAGTTLYYSYHGNSYRMPTSATGLPRTALLPQAFDALGVDPTDGTIYGADSRAYSGDGRVSRYRANGTAIDGFDTAVGPTQFVF